MTFYVNVQIKTVNHYTHIITLPTTLKQALLLPDPVLQSETGVKNEAKDELNISE